MAKKVIWVLNQTAGKSDSGWGERHYYLAQKWIESGYQVYIVSGSYNHLFMNQPKIGEKAFTVEKISDNLNFCWVKIPTYDGGSIYKLWSMIVFAFRSCFLNSRTIPKPTIILVSSMPIFSIISGIFLKRKYKAKRLLFEIRDLWPLTPMYLSNYSRFHPMIILMKWIEKLGYKKADFIVSVLPNSYKYIDRISNVPEKFKYIPNGIDEKILEPESLSRKIVDSIPKDKFVIGYTGTMGMANALEYFVEASCKLKDNNDIYFVLVGDGYLKEALVDVVGNNQNILFIEKIRKKQVQSVLKLFDICFIGRNKTPLFDYGVSSNKYFDYMLAGKPILESSNFIKSPSQLAGSSITVEAECSDSIVKGLLEFYNLDEKEMNKFSVLGIEFVKKYHNFDYLSSEYLKLF